MPASKEVLKVEESRRPARLLLELFFVSNPSAKEIKLTEKGDRGELNGSNGSLLFLYKRVLHSVLLSILPRPRTEVWKIYYESNWFSFNSVVQFPTPCLAIKQRHAEENKIK